MGRHSKQAYDRHGARQKQRFNPGRAPKLDDPARFEYLPPREIACLLDILSGGKPVDFGTGTETYAIEPALLRPNIEVIAVDELPQILDRPRAKPAAVTLTNLKPILAGEFGDLEKKIDRVLALNVLHELGGEASRVIGAALKLDGTALIIDWNARVERPPIIYTRPVRRARAWNGQASKSKRNTLSPTTTASARAGADSDEVNRGS